MYQVNQAEPAHPQADVLDRLGISEVRDSNGYPTWTITVGGPTQGSEPLQAVFNRDTRCWELQAICEHEVRPARIAEEANQISRSQSPDWWTRMLPRGVHTDFLVNTDWSFTSLGPLQSWSFALRSSTSMCLSKSLATILVWGKDWVAIYNEALIPILGDRHPDIMGKCVTDQWPEVAPGLMSCFDEVEQSPTGHILHALSLYLERHGYLEETWWDVDVLPLKEEDGSVAGFCFTWFEITRQVIGDRLSRLVNEVGIWNGDDQDVWKHLCTTFADHPRDIAMCIMFSVDGSNGVLKREGTIGVGTGHIAAPDTLDLENESTGFAPILHAARTKTDEYLIIDTTKDALSPEVMENIDWQGYGEASKFIAIIPVVIFDSLLKGFAIVGLNPRMTLDNSLRQFLSDLSRRLRALLTAVTNSEQAKQRGDLLMQDLAAKEKRIRKMAHLAPMGMYDLSAEGQLLWANNHFFDILGAQSTQKDMSSFSWLDYIHPDDHEAAKVKMAASIIEQVNISDSLRLRKTWSPPEVLSEEAEQHEKEPMWVLYQAYPHIEDGMVESIMGCITDISQFKWAERVQARSAEAARAAKQRLEDFIDITSHEMRNPLSAVTQCADDILSSVSDAQHMLGGGHAAREELAQIADTAKSISLCAAHQKRIIDDVLTLSKLDSTLLSVVPVASRPSLIVSDAMRMFTAEFASSDIQVDLVNESPEAFNGQEHAYFDATRLMQVLVNLITNAIKFTRAEAVKEVAIRYGISDVPPSEDKFGPDFAWSSSTRKRRDLSSDTRYGEGSSIYLHFSVKDTGQGLPKHEAVHIFDKFIQANRRTYIKYGGSGLGLFISRELIELQSGRIGVSSETGKGSTFAFYVKARRGTDVQAPEDRLQSFQGSTASGRSRKDSQSMGSSQISPDAADVIMATAGMTQADATNAFLPTAPTAQHRSNVDRWNILLVEDNLVNQKVLTKQLRKAGFTVAIAHHGGEAVDRLLEIAGHDAEYDTPRSSGGSNPVPFDCVLMDWEMPVLDGLSATRRIRELEQAGIIRPKQVIIGVTANARVEQIQMAEAAGMDEIVVKPFRVPDLVERIELALANGG